MTLRLPGGAARAILKAIGLITRRLNEAFPLAKLDVLGTPRDLGAAQALSDADKTSSSCGCCR